MLLCTEAIMKNSKLHAMKTYHSNSFYILLTYLLVCLKVWYS